ncbi:MAG: glycosyltransferase family 4 protein [Candidatus Omnitrophica bacterium]|nr:glycosyltransferase family 4 protein [Candidatus Omnitrophota bacterium]
MAEIPPGVLMVTGAYDPELSGGGLQCRELIRALRSRARCGVLTTATEAAALREEQVDRVPVYRVSVDVTRLGSQVRAGLRLTRRFLELQHDYDVVHIHGFSRKAILLTLLARLKRKRVVWTFHTGGHDAPEAIRAHGRLAAWAYDRADAYTSVSPELHAAHGAAGVPSGKLAWIPNGVDLERFQPASAEDRRRLRQRLGLPADRPVILFVGFFSNEKQPDALFEAWQRLPGETTLLFIGATRSRYREVDPALAPRIRDEAQRRGLASRLRFVEQTKSIEDYFRAADLYVLPSSREGMPLALLEAMACGVPCIASRLPGSTDTIIEDGVNGALVPPSDVTALEQAMRRLLDHPDEAAAMGVRARATIAERFSIEQTAERYFELYQRLTSGHRLSDMRHATCNTSEPCSGIHDNR